MKTSINDWLTSGKYFMSYSGQELMAATKTRISLYNRIVIIFVRRNSGFTTSINVWEIKEYFIVSIKFAIRNYPVYLYIFKKLIFAGQF